MQVYKSVYSLQNGKLIKNKENKVEYFDEHGKKRVKTNPSYKDFLSVGKYRLKRETKPEHNTQKYDLVTYYEIIDEYLVEKYILKEKKL